VAKPGLINGPGRSRPFYERFFLSVIGVPNVQVTEIAATLLNQVINGFEKDTLKNDDLVAIGRRALGQVEGGK
jgi:hypothetical protein